MKSTTSDDVPELVDRLFRRESARLVATLTRAFGAAELQLAEDAVQEALVKALRLWPYRGVPEHPTAWLARVARNRALDILRRRQNWTRKQETVVHTVEYAALEVPGDGALDDELQMLLLCCHPALKRRDQVALTLKIAAGLSAEEIARALLTRRKTIEQRLVRAKRRLREQGARLELQTEATLGHRLDVVHEVLYLIFNEGYASSTHSDWVRTELCAEALRLVDLLADHPRTRTAEGDALRALFAFQAARFPARLGADGDIVELEDQDRGLWDQRLLARALRAFDESARGDVVSRYHLEAEIAAHWTLEKRPDWAHVLRLYEELREIAPSPVIDVHHAVALARSGEPRAALAILDELRADRALEEYVPFHVARGEVALLADAAEPAIEALETARRLVGDNALGRRLGDRLLELRRTGNGRRAE